VGIEKDVEILNRHAATSFSLFKSSYIYNITY
jgi:hypothetical protein